MLTLEDRQTGSGAFFSSFFFLVKKTGGAFRIQSVTDRGPNVVNGYKLFIKVWKIRPAVPVLHNEATEPLCIPHARFPKAVRYYILKLFFPPLSFLSVPFCIDHRRFTAGIKLFHTGNVHAHLSPCLAAGLRAVPYTHCVEFCKFHRFLARRQSVVSLSCVTVYTSTSAQHCMRAYSSPRWQRQ